MKLTIGIKSMSVDNIRYSIVGGAVEYMPSTSEKTPIVDDSTGNMVAVTEEKKPGMIKMQVALKNSADNSTLRNLDGGNIVLELINGITVTGSNMVQISANSSVISDGKTEFEFAGDVKEK